MKEARTREPLLLSHNEHLQTADALPGQDGFGMRERLDNPVSWNNCRCNANPIK